MDLHATIAPKPRSVWVRLAWLPVIATALAILVFYVLDLPQTFGSPRLTEALAFIFLGLASSFVAILIARSFWLRGSPGLLVVGCGVVLWGVSGHVNNLVAHGNANISVTIHNLCIGLSALCHLLGVILTLRSQRTLAARGWWIAGGYGLALGAAAVVVAVTLAGWTPTFFVQGQGGTPVRSFVLGSAIALCLLTAALLRLGYRQSLSVFAHWYSLALILMAIGLFGVMVQPSINSLIGWAGKASQYLSGLYLLVAALASVRATGEWEIPLTEALRVSEDRFRAGFDHGAVPMALAAPDGRFLKVNSALCQMLGYTESELLTRTFPALTHPDDWPVNRQMVEQLLKGEIPSMRMEKRYLHKNGHAVWADMSSAVVRDAANRPLYFVTHMHDITERKKAEETIVRERGLLQNLIDGAKNTHLVLLDRDFNFMRVNDAYARTCGYRPEEMVGKNHFALYPHPENEAIFRRVRDTGEPFEVHDKPFEFPDQPERGVTYWDWTLNPVKDTSGQVMALVFALHETTARKRAEEALRQINATLEQRVTEQTVEIRKAYDATQTERQRLYEVFETLPVMICLLTADYRVAFANRAFRAQFGQTQGRRCYEHCFGLSQPCEFCQSFTPLKTGQPHHWEVNTPTGRIIDAYDFPFRDVDGTAMVLEMDIDITERRQADRDLAARTAEVQRQADQLRALATELTQAEQKERHRLARILHDHIQQLIVSAQMQVSLVKRGDTRVIQSAAQGIDSILSESLLACRSLTVELCPPVLHQSGLAPALSWLGLRMGEQQQFKVHVRSTTDAEPATPELRAFLFEATREILLNTLKHSGVREAHVTMLRTKEDECRIIVEDKGKGFDPGGVKPGPSGGFGMFSIQQRLMYLGGAMQIESSPGKGTRTTLTVAIGQKAAPQAAPTTGGPTPASVCFQEKGRRIRVLLVDDHQIMRQGLASLLQFENDIEIIAEADNGQKAVDLARERQPDVVVMDVNMPVMDGIEATRILSKEMPQVKVIGLSMHMDKDAANAMREAGAVAYLTKGGPSEDLAAAIRACRRPGSTAGGWM